jgi:hypothetical protein
VTAIFAEVLLEDRSGRSDLVLERHIVWVSRLRHDGGAAVHDRALDLIVSPVASNRKTEPAIVNEQIRGGRMKRS